MSFRSFRPHRRSRSKYGADDIASTFATSIGFRKWDVPPPSGAGETDALKRFASGGARVDTSAGKTYTGVCGAYPHYTFGYVAPVSGSTLARRAILVQQSADDKTGSVILEGADYAATVQRIGKDLAIAQSATCAPAKPSTTTEDAAPQTVSMDAPKNTPPSKSFDLTPLLVAAAVGGGVVWMLNRKQGQ